MKLKSKKSALVLSFVSVMLCVAMLVGSTFAWFTDTASANVNRIQSGNLDVDIVNEAGTSIEGETLSFRNKDDSADILWEPGAKFELDSFKIVNKGDLALKYTVTVNGLSGNAKLLEVIDFTVKVGDGTEMELADLNGTLLPENATEIPTGADKGETGLITIYGKMQETAGNEYKNLSVDGISITVNATQASYENDSIGNTYDENADMTPDNLDKMVSANVTETVTDGAEKVFKNADETVTLTAEAGSLTDGTYTLTVTPKTTVDSSITVKAEQSAKAYDIKLADENGDSVRATEDKKFTVTLFVGKNLTNVVVYHNAAAITADYDESTGYVTFETDSFSPYTVVYDAPAAMIGSTYYGTLADAFAAAEDGDTVTLLRDASGDGIVVASNKFANNGLTVDFNGHSYTVGGVLVGSSGTGTNAFQLNANNTLIFKNGSIIGVTENTKPAEDTPDWHGAPAIMIQNYSNLTLENMVVTGGDETVCTLSNNCGDVKIKNTTINQGKAKGYKTPAYAFDVYGGFQSYDDVTVTVEGRSIVNGKIFVNRDTGTQNYNRLIISDGTFNGKLEVDANEKTEVSITGGTFSVDPSAYVASGYSAVKNDDNTYTVVEGIVVNSSQELANALTTSAAGTVIILNCNIEELTLSEDAVVASGIIIDGQNKKFGIGWSAISVLSSLDGIKMQNVQMGL